MKVELNGSQRVDTLRGAGTVTLVLQRVTSNFLPKQLAMFHSATVTSLPQQKLELRFLAGIVFFFL